jgi:hypothetical protein
LAKIEKKPEISDPKTVTKLKIKYKIRIYLPHPDPFFRNPGKFRGPKFWKSGNRGKPNLPGAKKTRKFIEIHNKKRKIGPKIQKNDQKICSKFTFSGSGNRPGAPGGFRPKSPISGKKKEGQNDSRVIFAFFFLTPHRGLRKWSS